MAKSKPNLNPKLKALLTAAEMLVHQAELDGYQLALGIVDEDGTHLISTDEEDVDVFESVWPEVFASYLYTRYGVEEIDLKHLLNEYDLGIYDEGGLTS